MGLDFMMIWCISEALTQWLNCVNQQRTIQSLAPAQAALKTNQGSIMRNKIEDIVVTILCLAIFAGWGVLLALGV